MKVEYIDHMGDDLRVANAARVSFDKESWWDCCPPQECTGECNGGDYDAPQLKSGDAKLIQYLAKHNHWTPFAHCTITMRETIPIFLARQRFKHTVGFTYNEVSRRYVDTPPEFYTPKVWRKRAENKKQGSSDEVVTEISFSNAVETWSDHPSMFYAMLLDAAEDTYNAMLKAGICPEQARMVLPQSMYTSYYVTGSLPAWSRAYLQRTGEGAQAEWDEVTEQWDRIITPLFPHSWGALVDAA